MQNLQLEQWSYIAQQKGVSEKATSRHSGKQMADMKLHAKKIPKIAVVITEVLIFATLPDVMMVTISRNSRMTPVQKRYLSL